MPTWLSPYTASAVIVALTMSAVLSLRFLFRYLRFRQCKHTQWEYRNHSDENTSRLFRIESRVYEVPRVIAVVAAPEIDSLLRLAGKRQRFQALARFSREKRNLDGVCDDDEHVDFAIRRHNGASLNRVARVSINALFMIMRIEIESAANNRSLFGRR